MNQQPVAPGTVMFARGFPATVRNSYIWRWGERRLNYFGYIQITGVSEIPLVP
jgi:hypothetical protein